MRLCHASRWKMAALITNHVIMWKPQHPQRITESLLDKMNDSLWTAYWWWLSMREMGGQICMWVCIYLEDLSEFWDYAEVSNWIWKMRWKCRITLDYYFTFNICNSWRNNGKWHQAERNSKSALQYLNPLFTESNATTWAMLHTCPAKENDTAIRHFGGQLLHLLCGCKLWFGEMHHFGSSECFSNVLIKVSPCCTPSPLSPPHFQE